jgi:hypothetical protein
MQIPQKKPAANLTTFDAIWEAAGSFQADLAKIEEFLRDGKEDEALEAMTKLLVTGNTKEKRLALCK